MQHTNMVEISMEGFDRNSAKAITAAVILGTVGASTILVMPGLLGVIVEALSLSEKQLGFVASVDIFTMAVATGASAFVLSRMSWRLLALAGLLVLALGNLFSLLVSTYSGILWARGVAGVGEGIAVAVSFAALGVTKNPDRFFGIYLVFGLLFSAIALYAFPFLVQLGGAALVFGSLIALCFINIAFLPWLTPKSKKSALSMEGYVPPSVLLVGIGFVMVTLFFIAQGAVWSYLERIGAAKEVPAQTISQALALSALAGIGGAGIAMLLGNSCRRSLPITVGIVVQIASMWLLTRSIDAGGFVVAVMLFNFSWNLCQPYFSGIMSELDPEGRVVVLMCAIQTVGVSVGPFIAALLIKNGNLDVISYMGIGCVIGALLATYLLLMYWRRSKAVVPNCYS